METTTAHDLPALRHLSVPQLRDRYAEVFGERPSTKNRLWLVKRLAWRLQSLAEGGLSESAQRRAAELACDADLRLNPPRPRAGEAALDRTATTPVSFKADGRLPPPGTVLTRPYKGGTVQVRVLADGFEYDGQVYGSLSAVAKAVTGSHCNGYLFFHLNANGDAR